MIACIVVITERSALRVTARAWKTTREATKSASRSMKEKLQQMEARRREEEIDALSSMEITMPVDPDPDPVPDTSQYIRNIKEYKPVSRYDDSISDEVPEFLKRKPVRLSTEPVQGGADAKRPIHDGPIDIPIISYNEYSQKLQNQRDAAALRDSGAPALSINPVQDSAAAASEPDTSKDGFDWSVLGGKPSFGEQESLSDWQTPAADTTGTPAKPARGENAVAKAAPVTKQEQEQVNEGIQQSLYASQAEQKVYVFPSIDLLDRARGDASGRQEQLYQNAHKLEQALLSFGVEATVTQVNQGPSVTRYELIPRQGVKVSRIVNLADDIALNLAAPSIRIEAPIPGKSAVGIEVPNKTPAMVTLREVIESDVFRKFPSKLAFSLGKTIDGELKVADIARMPHLLIAGTTGSGKSVCINSLLISLLYKADPKDVKMILIDPKVVELSIYNGIPHLLTPVVNDPKKAAAVLNWAVQEMTNRYKAFADNNVRDIRGYNEAVRDRAREGELMEAMPQIVIVIDELADLMMVAGKEVETAICRLAQMARAAGMHLVIATQRPSVDVITGLIKANIPSRLAFAVSSGVDSKTILDTVGAEKLLGRGDMLFWPIGDSKATRIQGTFVSDHEVERVVQAVKEQELQTSFSEEIMRKMESSGGEGGQTAGSDDDNDELLPEAIDFVLESQKASISLLQRKFRIGFNRAARLVDAIAERGLLGPDEGNNKGRKVLMTKDEYYNSNSEDQI
ncbi:MAG: DNA translocase FtsK [Firmicutes bacterium]|nr:DNA translocase FtsK [Bacillota bacterium]